MCALANGRPPTSTNSPNSSPAIYITGVTVIDPETGAQHRDQTVVISGKRISEVKPSSDIQPPVGANVVDAAGKYLIPGLCDMHVHGTYIDSTLPLYIANGVTTVREMFGPPDANRFRVYLAAKEILRPNIILGSPLIDGNPPRWRGSIVANTPEEARRIVGEQKRKGADFIKVYDRLSRDAYFAILEESQLQDIPVAGHVPYAISAWEASAGGQKSIEHLCQMPLACSSREQELWPRLLSSRSKPERAEAMLEVFGSYSDHKCRRLLQELKKNGTWGVPTLILTRALSLIRDPQPAHDERLRYFGREAKRWIAPTDDAAKPRKSGAGLVRESLRYNQMLAREMFRAGVPMLAGTDAVNPYCFPGFSLHDELALLVGCGVTPLEALRAATHNPALFMNSNNEYGTVAAGKIADLVLLDGDPLENIQNTARICQVFLSGKQFNRAALDRLLQEAEAAARAGTPA